MRVMQECLPEFVQILGTHPLFGPDSGQNGIVGLKVVLCPVRIEAALRRADPAGARRVSASGSSTRRPEEHDRQAARTQAIFHLLARAMGRLGWGDEEIATPGPEAFFRQVTTLQNDSFQLFVDMQRDNPFAATYREEFLEALATPRPRASGLREGPGQTLLVGPKWCEVGLRADEAEVRARSGTPHRGRSG